MGDYPMQYILLYLNPLVSHYGKLETWKGVIWTWNLINNDCTLVIDGSKYYWKWLYFVCITPNRFVKVNVYEISFVKHSDLLYTTMKISINWDLFP